jgi:hypothetical protein
VIYGISLGWIILAAVVYFAIGSLWYSPAGFIKPWMKELGIKAEGPMKGLAPLLVKSFIFTLILVLVEAYFVHITKSPSWMNGAYLGIKIWVGFIATTTLINAVYEKRSMKLWAIDQGYHLVGLTIAGAILVH